MNDETPSMGGSEDLAGGSICSNSPTDGTVSHSRGRLADFYAARDKIAQARAAERARAEGVPMRAAGVDEQLRLIDDGVALDDGSAVGND